MNNTNKIESKPMPIKIKKNFIYRKVWREVFNNDSNATFIIIGKPGTGKSTIALRMAEDLDPTFTTERVCFNISQFLKLIDIGDSKGQLYPGNVIIFDEIVTDQGAESRSAMSKNNKLMTYITATYRAKRLVVIYCLPSLMQLDKNLRDINVTGIFEIINKDTTKKMNKAKFTWQMYDARTQHSYYIYPRLISSNGLIKKVSAVWFGMPSPELEKDYKIRKMHYLDENIRRWNELVQQQEAKDSKKKTPDHVIIKTILNNKEKYYFENRWSIVRIVEDLHLPINTAARIIGDLHQMEKLGKSHLFNNNESPENWLD